MEKVSVRELKNQRLPPNKLCCGGKRTIIINNCEYCQICGKYLGSQQFFAFSGVNNAIDKLLGTVHR